MGLFNVINMVQVLQLSLSKSRLTSNPKQSVGKVFLIWTIQPPLTLGDWKAINLNFAGLLYYLDVCIYLLPIVLSIILRTIDYCHCSCNLIVLVYCYPNPSSSSSIVLCFLFLLFSKFGKFFIHLHSIAFVLYFNAFFPLFFCSPI